MGYGVYVQYNTNSLAYAQTSLLQLLTINSIYFFNLITVQVVSPSLLYTTKPERDVLLLVWPTSDLYFYIPEMQVTSGRHEYASVNFSLEMRFIPRSLTWTSEFQVFMKYISGRKAHFFDDLLQKMKSYNYRVSHLELRCQGLGWDQAGVTKCLIVREQEYR